MRLSPPFEQRRPARRSDRVRASRLRRQAAPSARGCGYRAELHDHRNASRPRASMATWLVGLPRSSASAAAARPIDFQKRRRRQILGADHRAAGNFEQPRSSPPRKRPQHAVAQIRQIGRARLQIFVGRGIVVRDLLVESGRPGHIRRRSSWQSLRRSDRGSPRRPAKPLEIRGFAPPRRRQHWPASRDLPPCRIERRAQREPLHPRARRSHARRMAPHRRARTAREQNRSKRFCPGMPAAAISARMFTDRCPENRWRRDRPTPPRRLRHPRRTP